MAVQQIGNGATQDIHIKRLDDIGIGTRLQSFELILIAVLRCQQDNGDEVGIGVHLQLRAELVTIHLRHHYIADHEVGTRAEHLAECLLAIGAGRHLILLPKFVLEIVADLVVVLDNHESDGAVAGSRLLYHLLFEFLHQAVHLRRLHIDLGSLSFEHQLLGIQMSLAQRDGHHELAALLQVMRLDRTMMELHKRARQVESDASTHVTVVHGRGTLIETLEDLLELLFGDLLAVVADGDMSLLVVVRQADHDLTTRRRELKGVGEDIDDDLIKLLAIDPDTEIVDIVLIFERHLLGGGLMLEEGVDIGDEGHEIGLRHAHHHLSLVNLTEVHHLIDQTQDALGVTTDGLIDTLAMRIGLVLDQREQGCHDERHRCTDLMTDVHEEAQLSLAQLLGMDMLLHATACLLPAAAPQDNLPEDGTDNEHIDEVSPRRAIPGTGHNHGESILGRLDIIALGLHTEAIGAWRHVREDNFVGSWQHVDIRFAVDAIEIRDVFGILVSQRGELHGKRIVVIAQAETVCALDGLSVDEEVRQTNHCLPLTLGNILGLEPGDTASTSEDQDAIVGDIRRAVAKLITLQTIIGKVVLEKTCTRIQTAQAMVRTYPEHAVRVALEGRDAIVGKSLLTIVLLEHLALHIVTIEALVGAHPDIAVILAGDTDWLSVVGTVHAKGVDPVLALDIETAKSHRRGYIEALAIGRERHLRDVVIGDTVDLLVVISSLLHHVLLDDIALGIHAEHAILHRGQPQASLLIALDIHHDEVLILGILHRVRLLRGRIDPAKALAIRAEPDTPLGIFCDRHHCGRHTFHIVLHYALLGIQTIKPVFIGTDPPPALTIDKGADDTGAAYQIALTKLISHIAEAIKRDGLLVDTLLQHAEPEVTTGVFDDGVDLALREIDLLAVEGVIGQAVVPGLIDGYSLSVVADDDAAEVIAIERRDST